MTFAPRREGASLLKLADPLGGMVTGGACHTFPADEPQLFVQALSFPVSTVGDQASTAGQRSPSRLGASGSGASAEIRAVPALAEMLERHAASCVEDDRLFTASASELGSYALDLQTLPACSARELENPKCYARMPRRDIAMRWVEGISLTTGKPCALPFAMVYLYAGRLLPQERLQAPISTGLAAHRSLAEALVSGLLEVIERDALSIMWLQMIPGHLLELPFTPSWCLAASARLKYFFFDVSTDLDVPVICCIRIAPDSQRAHSLISCAAGFGHAALIEKTVRDIGAHSIGFRADRPMPSAFEDFTAIHHGATYMAHAERASAWAFLLDGERNSSKVACSSELDAKELHDNTPDQQMSYLLDRLSACGMEAYAVDLTSVEAFSAGMRVVRVVVPGLQPLPYRYTTRYLAHPRLYDAPRRMGYRVLAESQINSWPHPFA